MHQDKSYIEIDFYKLWRYIRLTRVQKETIKNILFYSMPFLFNRFASFQYWKNALIFSENKKFIVPNLRSVDEIKLPVTRNEIPKPIDSLAIVMHVFYLDVFNDILSMILHMGEIKIKLFITCPEYLSKDVQHTLLNFSFPFYIMSGDNRGRDILPFVKILPKVLEENCDLVLKIHTKRSNHLNKKNLWGTDLFEKLLTKSNFDNIRSVFEKYPQIGMLGPAGNILPMSLYYGGNAKLVESLSLKMGLSRKQLKNLNFVAGSMFYARSVSLLPLLNLCLNDNEFELENKQLDNTMAHAIERVFAAGLIVSGQYLVDSLSTGDKGSCKLTLNHPWSI